MFQSRILHCFTIFALISYFNGTGYAKKCTDCISMLSCEGAMSILANLQRGDKDSLRRAKSAICGFEGFDPLVCCSKFSSNNDTIEQHPNEALLPDKCGNSYYFRADGTIKRLTNEFPWMVLIDTEINGRSRQCGGSIINARYILTAAHCLLPNRHIKEIRIGDSDLLSSYDCPRNKTNEVCESIQIKKVEKLIIHPQYRDSTSQYDIGLIRLSTPIDFTKRNAEPICLPLSKNFPEKDLEGKIVTIIGWSYVRTIDRADKILKIDLLVTRDGDCLKYNNNTRKIICAGSTDFGSACYGTGGGAMMRKAEYKGVYRYIQYGIVSYRNNECTFGNPGTNTYVTKFIPWILDNIEE